MCKIAQKEKDKKSDTIMEVLIRNEVQILVQHPRIQKELNHRWGPDLSYDWSFNEFWDNNAGIYISWSELPLVTIRSRRFKFAMSTAFYLLFIALTTVVLLWTNLGDDKKGFLFANVIRNRLLEDDLPYDSNLNLFGATFHDIQTIPDFWLWMKGPLLESIDEDPHRFDQMISPIRLRQFRSDPDACSINTEFEWLFSRPGAYNRSLDCFSEYNLNSLNNKSPYGPAATSAFTPGFPVNASYFEYNSDIGDSEFFSPSGIFYPSGKNVATFFFLELILTNRRWWIQSTP